MSACFWVTCDSKYQCDHTFQGSISTISHNTTIQQVDYICTTTKNTVHGISMTDRVVNMLGTMDIQTLLIHVPLAKMNHGGDS